MVFLIVNGWCHPERALRESKNPGNTRGLSTPAAAASAQDDKKSGRTQKLTNSERSEFASGVEGRAASFCRVIAGSAGYWCAGRDLNPHGISTTSPSNSRVCRSTTRALWPRLVRGPVTIDSRDFRRGSGHYLWPRLRAALVPGRTNAAWQVTKLYRRTRLGYGPGFGATGLAWLAGAAGITGAVIGAGFAGTIGTVALDGTTTLRLTPPPDPKILPVKRRVEA